VSVVNKIIFIEGNARSVDYIFYTKLLKAQNVSLTVHPIGGKREAGAYRQAYQDIRKIPPTSTFILLDRDLDVLPSDKGQLIDSGNRLYRTGRTCVESYFIDPDLMLRYLHEQQKKVVTAEFIEQSLNTSVAALVPYQAVRWSLQHLRMLFRQEALELGFIKRLHDAVNFPNRLTDDDGAVPTQLDDLKFLHTQSYQLIDRFPKVTTLLTQDTFNQKFDETLALFQQQHFITSRGYLWWFHGKDLMSYWRKQLETHRLDTGGYQKWAADQVALERFADLKELDAILKQ
jgi:hypothetical protein